MTPAGCRLALKRLGLSRSRAADLFGRGERMVYYWCSDDGEGPPEHVALALTEMMDGNLEQTPRSVRAFVRRNYTRRVMAA